MNRTLAIACILLAPTIAKSQSPMFGLFSSHYIQENKFTGENQRINKPIGIIYSADYCWIISPNGDKIGFRTTEYTKTADTNRRSIHESFLSGECRTTTQGFYTIMVDQMDNGYTFQIASPTGTMIATHAQRYSENGRIKPGDIKIDWGSIKTAMRKNDSLNAVIKLRERQYRDSVLAQRHSDSLLRDSLWTVARRLGITTTSDPSINWLQGAIKLRTDTANHKNRW